MPTSHPLRRQRAAVPIAFSSPNLSAFLGHQTSPAFRSSFMDKTACPSESRPHFARDVAITPKTKRSSKQSPSIHYTPIVMVAASSPSQVSGKSRFAQPVPAAKPHEVFPPKRGRNSRRRSREAEHFRKYLYLRKQLKPWSDSFREKHGRTPSLIDVHASDIPGLLDRFVEYLEALEGLRFEV